MKIVIHDFWKRSRDAKDFALGAEVDIELRCRIIGLETERIDVTSFKSATVSDVIDGEQTMTLHVVHAEMEEA